MAHNNFDSDRRSAVSSFYGAPKSSFDMLNGQNARAGTPGAGIGGSSASRHDRDDASSFYGSQRAPRGSTDMLVSQSAGYNRASFFDVGREAPVKGIQDEEDAFLGSRQGATGRDEEAGWDVFADFNNAGPRYSTAFVKYDEGYQRLPPDSSASVRTPTKVEEDAHTQATGAPVELVTVPALGAEWKKSELEAMTKKGRRKLKDNDQGQKFREWNRDQRGCCGRYGTRKQVAIGLFIICVLVGIALGICLPRVPAFSFNSVSPLLNGTAPPETIFSRSPANFSFAAKLDLKVNTDSNILPLKLKHINAEIFDSNTNERVATGTMSATIPGKSIQEIQLPLNFTYLASNDSDTTWNNWYDACRNSALYTDGQRPGVDFYVKLKLGIFGLIGDRSASTQITNVACPFELSQTAA